MARILVVDDSKELLDVFRLIFSLNELEVRTASSKAELLAQLSPFAPDIILLDVLLGGENGREVCKSIKENNFIKSPKIILFSGSPDLLFNYKECLADDILEKPFDITTLIEKITKLLDPAVSLINLQ